MIENKRVRTPPLLIAHRGESRDAPENTLASINLAWARGAAAVEIDVRLGAGGEPVVIHDADTRRIGGPATPVARQTTAQLRSLDAGRWKSRRWAGERIPFLREVLETTPEGGRLIVELKEGPESVAPVASAWEASALRTQLRAHQLTFMSFNHATVAELARECGSRSQSRARGAPVCLLLEKKIWRQPCELARALDFAREHRLAALNLEAGPALDQPLIARIHEEGLRVYCWTVNRIATARRLLRAGIDGVTTDRCAWMRERLGIEFS
ncbi:MAG: glycerophosphodiester phosphodiesterase [Opitutaceae bacterium]